jgi:hypothetical protein
MVASFARGFCLALDNIAKAMPADGKQLKPVRFVNGEPVFRFRVEAIRCGNYLTADGEAFEVTPATLKHWTDMFKMFKDRKIPVPVPSGTHFQVDGEHNRGNVIGLTSDGKSLWADVELVGKDAPRIAASNGVSIFAEPEWQDTHGNKYQWPIRHMLLTPDPRIPGLKGFMPIAANNTTIHVPVLRYQAMPTARPAPNKNGKPARQPARRPLALDDTRAMNEDGLGVPGPGDGAALPDDESSTYGDLNAEPEMGKGGTKALKAHIKDHFTDKAHTVLDDEAMEHLDKLEAIKELLAEMERILEAFKDEEGAEPENEQIEQEQGPKGAAMGNAKIEEALGGKGTAMSNIQRVARDPLFAQNVRLIAENRQAKLDALMLSGQISSKPQYDMLIKQHCDITRIASKSVLALSNRTNPDEDFDAVIALLRLNPESPYGEQSGEQLAPANPIALANPYRQNQVDADAAAVEQESLMQPSSTRVSKRK